VEVDLNVDGIALTACPSIMRVFRIAVYLYLSN
jgi:hypothetical protein